MDLADWRDIALIFIGIVYGLVTLLGGTIAFALWYFSRKGFGALDRLVDQRVRPMLDKAEQQLLAVRDRTASLPGSPALGAIEGEGRTSGGGLLALTRSLPFRRKKRRRIPFLPSR